MSIKITTEGTVKRFNEAKGYGFITSTMGDFFTHITRVENHEPLKRGQRVEFSIGAQKDGRTIAENVRVICQD